MLEEVFVDASFWAAFMLNTEERHNRARELWDYTFDRDWKKVTTNWALYEAMTFINRRGRHDLALDLLELASITTTVIDVSNFEQDTLRTFVSNSDKRWSIVDCANLICIKQRQSALVMSFDRDFALAQRDFGFRLLGAGRNTNSHH